MSSESPEREVPLYFLVWHLDRDTNHTHGLTTYVTFDDIKEGVMLADGRKVKSVVGESVLLDSGEAITKPQALEMLVPDMTGKFMEPDGDTTFEIVQGPDEMGWVLARECAGSRKVKALLLCDEPIGSDRLFRRQTSENMSRLTRADRTNRAKSHLLRAV